MAWTPPQGAETGPAWTPPTAPLPPPRIGMGRPPHRPPHELIEDAIEGVVFVSRQVEDEVAVPIRALKSQLDALGSEVRELRASVAKLLEGRAT
jgi:hypothetical protein